MQNQSQSTGEDELFPGQQEGERVLYIIRPHGLRRLVYNLKMLALGVGAFYIWKLGYPHLRNIPETLVYRIYGLIILVSLFGLWWVNRVCNVARAYITDRRLVRFEAAFPALEKRRALLWTEVTKTSAFCKNAFLRMMKVGTLRVVPFVHQLDDVEILYTYYVEDLVSYIDKIVYLVKSQSPDLRNLRPFVPKAKGKRYEN